MLLWLFLAAGFNHTRPVEGLRYCIATRSSCYGDSTTLAQHAVCCCLILRLKAAVAEVNKILGACELGKADKSVLKNNVFLLKYIIHCCELALDAVGFGNKRRDNLRPR